MRLLMSVFVFFVWNISVPAQSFPVANSDRAEAYLREATQVLGKFSSIEPARAALTSLKRDWVVVDLEKTQVIDLPELHKSNRHAAFLLAPRNGLTIASFKRLPESEKNAVLKLLIVNERKVSDLFRAAELVFNINIASAERQLLIYNNQKERNARATLQAILALNRFFEVVTDGKVQEKIQSFRLGSSATWRSPYPMQMEEMKTALPAQESWTWVDISVRDGFLVWLYNVNLSTHEDLLEIFRRQQINLQITPGTPSQPQAPKTPKLPTSSPVA